MSLKIRKGVPLIDQHDRNGMWGGKFGGNYIPETLKKPIDDLENKWKSFGWNTITIDGHDDQKLENAYKELNKNDSNKPRVIILKNVKQRFCFEE